MNEFPLNSEPTAGVQSLRTLSRSKTFVSRHRPRPIISKPLKAGARRLRWLRRSVSFARICGDAAEVLAAMDSSVHCWIGPTRRLTFPLKSAGRKLVGGVMITASHNPPEFNGFKVKAHFGGSATPAITAKIEANLEDALSAASTAGMNRETSDRKPLLRSHEVARRLGSDCKFEIENRRRFDARLWRVPPRRMLRDTSARCRRSAEIPIRFLAESIPSR